MTEYRIIEVSQGGKIVWFRIEVNRWGEGWEDLSGGVNNYYGDIEEARQMVSRIKVQELRLEERVVE